MSCPFGDENSHRFNDVGQGTTGNIFGSVCRAAEVTPITRKLGRPIAVNGYATADDRSRARLNRRNFTRDAATAAAAAVAAVTVAAVDAAAGQ